MWTVVRIDAFRALIGFSRWHLRFRLHYDWRWMFYVFDIVCGVAAAAVFEHKFLMALGK